MRVYCVKLEKVELVLVVEVQVVELRNGRSRSGNSCKSSSGSSGNGSRKHCQASLNTAIFMARKKKSSYSSEVTAR